VYLSARVTLGRALLELEQYPEARTELEYVLHAAPDNLLALKAMIELQNRAGSGPSQSVPGPPRPSLSFAASPAPIPVAEPEPVSEPVSAPPSPPPNPALGELEGWKARIETDRARRSSMMDD
jgi:hypothetical protein